MIASPDKAIDNFVRAERLGFIEDAEHWLQLRKLRDRMVHEYIDDPRVLAEALQGGHEGVAELADTLKRPMEDMRDRGWLSSPAGE